MRFKSLALAVASLALTACYHVTVVHNPAGVSQASAPVVVDQPFSHSFIAGLVPPAELNVKQQCPRGVSKVETEMSFLNGLIAGITWQLYSPVHATVTCKT